MTQDNMILVRDQILDASRALDVPMFTMAQSDEAFDAEIAIRLMNVQTVLIGLLGVLGIRIALEGGTDGEEAEES